MPRIPRVVLLIESSRASGRGLLNGVAEYVHYHGPWLFYWEPAGLEGGGPALHSLKADGIILRDGKRLEEVRAFEFPEPLMGWTTLSPAAHRVLACISRESG